MLAERGRIDSSHQMTDEILECVHPITLATSPSGWTCTHILQTSIRDSGGLFPPTNHHYRHQHPNGGSTQYYAWHQQSLRNDKIKAAERLYHRWLPDRCLSHPVAETPHEVTSSPATVHIFIRSLSVHAKLITSICTYSNDTCVYFDNFLPWLPILLYRATSR